jgi:hypothetical protein
MCNCIDQANAKLLEHNTKIEPMFGMLPGRMHEVIGTRTVKVNKSKRGNAKTILATFCPFCGNKRDG